MSNREQAVIDAVNRLSGWCECVLSDIHDTDGDELVDQLKNDAEATGDVCRQLECAINDYIEELEG